MPPRDPNRGKDKFVRHEHSYNILPKSPSRRLVRTPHEEDDAPYHAASPRQLFRHPHIEAITGEQYDVYHRLPTGASTSNSWIRIYDGSSNSSIHHARTGSQSHTARTSEASIQGSGQNDASNSESNKAGVTNSSFMGVTDFTGRCGVSFVRCIYDCWTYVLGWILSGFRDVLSGRMFTIFLALLANSSRSASVHCHFHPTVSRICHTFGVQAALPQPDINYASLGLGASIITEITSPTYSRYRPDVNAARVIMGYEQQKSLPPSTILQYVRRPGHCWPLEGSSGHVGIKLSAQIRIRQVSLEHIAQGTKSYATAPRTMRLWGVKHYPTEVEMSSTQNLEFEPSSGLVSLTEAAFGPQTVLAPLASLHYDPSSGNTTQHFNITQEESPCLQHIVLEIVDNWGDDSRTCLYGLRVYGVPGSVV